MWNEVWWGGVWVGMEETEISIKQGTAESPPEELRRQYPDSGSLTKQCVLNAKLLQTRHPSQLETAALFKGKEGVAAAGRKTPLIVHIMKYLRGRAGE